MQQKYLVLLLLLSFFANGQNRFVTKLTPLDKYSGTKSAESLRQLRHGRITISDRSFIGLLPSEGVRLLVCDTDTTLHAYRLPISYSSISSFSVQGFSKNKNYLFATVSHPGNNGISRGNFIIIDLKHQSYFLFNNYIFPSEFDKKDQLIRDGRRFYKSQISIDNQKLTIFTSCDPETEPERCKDQGGTFKIENNRLVRTSFLNPTAQRFEPVNYIGQVVKGMNIEEVRIMHPKASLEHAPEEMLSCADIDLPGYSIREKGELLQHIVVDSLQVKRMLVVSPKIKVSGISTGMTVEEVLQKYPESTIEIGSLTDWEELFISELNIGVIFLTTNQNRIGIYAYDNIVNDTVFKKLARKTAKANFIVAY